MIVPRGIWGLALALGLALTPPALAGQGKTELLWLGQAAFRIDTPGGKVILIDPFITQNPKTPAATRMIRPHFAIPMHYGTTPQLAGTPEQYIAALGKTATEVKVVQPGGTVVFDRP